MTIILVFMHSKNVDKLQGLINTTLFWGIKKRLIVHKLLEHRVADVLTSWKVNGI